MISSFTFSQNWEQVGLGANSYVYKLYTDTTNNLLYASGNFKTLSIDTIKGIAKWNGIIWDSLGSGLNYPEVPAIVCYKNELYVGGCFCKADGNIGNGIQKWNGHEWKEVGGGVTLTNYYFSAVKGMAVINDRLYITGDFDKAGFLPVHGLACWDGLKWCTIYDVFSTHVWAFSEYKNNLVLGGNFEINNDSSLSYLVEYLEPSFTDTCSQPFRVPENANESNISVYPNPVKDYLYINLESEINEVSIQIYDIEGRMITDENLKSSSNIIKIDTKALSYGTYFVKLISNTINGTSLFIKL